MRIKPYKTYQPPPLSSPPPTFPSPPLPSSPYNNNCKGPLTPKSIPPIPPSPIPPPTPTPFSPSPPVYVLDTGVRSTHHDFTGRLGEGTCLVPGCNSYEDDEGHGTFTSATVMGNIHGVARGAILHPVGSITDGGGGHAAPGEWPN